MAPTPTPTPTPTASAYSSLLTLPSPRRFLKPLSPSPRLLSSPLPSPPLSSSYNGWGDLSDDPAHPLADPAAHGLLLILLLLPLATLSRLRLPPLPLLAAGFTAGFAARHLFPSSPHAHRLADLLSELDTRVRALRDHLARSHGGDLDALLQAADCVRAGVGDATRLVEDERSRASSSLPAVMVVMGNLAKDVAERLGGLARETMRELSSPRKRAKEKVAASAASVDGGPEAKSSGAGIIDEERKGVGGGQENHEKKLSDSRVDPKGQMPVGTGCIGHGTGEEKLLASRNGGGRRKGSGLDMLPYGEDAVGLDSSVQSKDDRLERLVFKHKCGHGDAQIDSVDACEGRGGGSRTRVDGMSWNSQHVRESKESSLLERTLEIRDRSYKLKIEHYGGESDGFVGSATNFDPIDDGDDDESGTNSDREEFSRIIKEATEILRKAREYMMARTDEDTVDALLYKSARLLSTAVALKPMSLLAVGQLGNTYLLHGELKLKISRELRALLAKSEALVSARDRGSHFRKVDRRLLSRENVSSALVDVCEECESLLVEAGRTYRMALSIDSGDVKALYNWGLALIFRAQLIADIGPKAAVDADKVYLAAIDKFDAMLSKSNAYAPEALYRWGTALQQRSHLRPQTNKEKIRLLEQAKTMFEDVLYVEVDNKLVREALSSCISELNYHGQWL